MNREKAFSGLAALSIYFGVIFLILFYYNVHKQKAKNFVEKNDNRVTVTLVNSNKTVLNKSSKHSTPLKPKIIHTPKYVVPKKTVPKKRTPKRVIPKKRIPKKIIPKKHIPKKRVPKKVVPKKRIPKKVIPKKRVPKKVVPKKRIPKKVIPKKHIPKKRIPKKVVPKKHVPKKVLVKKRPKKSAKDLFSSIKTKDVSKHPSKKRPVKKRPTKKTPKKESSVKHSRSALDRIKASHQSGRTSNKNRESGVKNAYIARVKRHMNNWDAGSAHKGQGVSIRLTIYNSGKFRYSIVRGGGGSMGSSLRGYLDRLNRMGLGSHRKSSPYVITVNFTAR